MQNCYSEIDKLQIELNKLEIELQQERARSENLQENVKWLENHSEQTKKEVQRVEE